MAQGTSVVLSPSWLTMSTLTVTAEQFTHSHHPARESVTEESLSLCSSDREPNFSQAVDGYNHPSPYRSSTAAAFADINRALAVRSLRDSVNLGPNTGQMPPGNLARPRPGIQPLLSTMYTTGTGASSNQAEKSTSQAPKRSKSSKSLPGGLRTPMNPEWEQEHTYSGGRRPVLHAHKTSVPPVVGVWKKKDKFPTSYVADNASNGTNAHKLTGGRDAVSGDTSTDGRRLSRRNRATTVTCIIM
jgi:hypothetical protein